MTEKDIEKSLNNVIGNMALEGSDLDDENIARCRSILEGKESCDDVVAEVIKRHRAIAEMDNQKHKAS